MLSDDVYNYIYSPHNYMVGNNQIPDSSTTGKHRCYNVKHISVAMHVPS